MKITIEEIVRAHATRPQGTEGWEIHPSCGIMLDLIHPADADKGGRRPHQFYGFSTKDGQWHLNKLQACPEYMGGGRCWEGGCNAGCDGEGNLPLDPPPPLVKPPQRESVWDVLRRVVSHHYSTTCKDKRERVRDWVVTRTGRFLISGLENLLGS